MKRTKDMAICALFAAFIAVMSQISIMTPSGIPFTLQTFAVCLQGVVLGWKRGVITAVVYVAIGAVGLPVFHNFTGGPQVLAGPTGGFLFGFIIMALLCGIRAGSVYLNYIFMLSGLALCHIMGTAWFSMVTGNSLIASFSVASLPYIIKDIISVVLAYMLGRKLERSAGHILAR
jgi:biotin transport system substrate-specific component